MLSRFERFTLSINALYRCWHRIADEEMAKYGLKGPYVLYLMALYRHPEGMTSAALCEDSARNKADVSRAVAVMEQKGLLCRTGDSAYRAKLQLTAVGRQAAEELRRRASQVEDIGGRGLTPEQREVFYATLAQIEENLRTVNDDGKKE
jgi:DNA-binding MarR family transcriptional regulator